MNVTIFIVSCRKHFHYLTHCLESIDKFCSGFRDVIVAVPHSDVDHLMDSTYAGRARFALNVLPFHEWEGKGMLHHELMIMRAYEHCHHSDAILHMDSDMLFTEPSRPEDFFVGKKPILVHAPFDILAAEDENVMEWKKAVDMAIGSNATQDTMRSAPWIHLTVVHKMACERIEQHTGLTVEDYIFEQKNDFPQSVPASSTRLAGLHGPCSMTNTIGFSKEWIKSQNRESDTSGVTAT